MGKTITDIPADNEWHFVQIPLKALEEKGRGTEPGIHPPDNFDWTSVDRFEIIPDISRLKELNSCLIRSALRAKK